jgi:chromosome partitioning protein
MRIVAVTNIKGGVGKTTTAVNLAYLMGRAGRRTLLWDLDPQAAATFTLRGVAGMKASAKKLVRGKRELAELLVPTVYPQLDLLPADFSYRNFDLHLNERKHPTERLLRMSAALGERYDYLFLDCPPGISLLSENALRAADAAIVPVVPSPLSVRMLGSLRDFVAREGWTDLVLLPFLSMVDRRRALHVELAAEARARFPDLLATEIPYWSEIERMSVRRAPLPAYSAHSAATGLYVALLDEVLQRLGADADAPPAKSRPEPAAAVEAQALLAAAARAGARDALPLQARAQEREG